MRYVPKPESVKVTSPPLMARIELSADEWGAVRMVALKQGITTQRLIGDVLRAMLTESEAA